MDISPNRFNVGFEAGYALALNKPIVAIRETPAPKEKNPVPFDIATLNCYFYERSNPEKLIEILSARIQIALETIKQ